MASSRKLNSADLSERVAAQIAPLLPAHSSILIGLSGGVDSVVLLHLLHRLAPRFSWQLSALHVHHGISPNADTWADFCAGLCADFDVALQIERVDIAPLREHGIEAAARKLRHAAFSGQKCDFVALAHHADDQAETLLLQLLRGAGVKGAAAMPLLAERAGSPSVLRPLLRCSRREILEYATTQGLRWIEDESNADDSYPRNFLRHRVLPLLEEKFPACRDTLARSAQHFAEASELLDDLARLDAPDLFPSPAGGITSDLAVDVRQPSRMASSFIRGVRGEGDELHLEISRLQSLSQPRAKNLLRWFLHGIGAPMPQTVQLDDMLRQLCDARQDAAVCVAYGRGYDTLPEKPTVRGSSRTAALPAPEGCAPPCPGGYWEVRRYQGRVYALRAPGGFGRNFVLSWHGEEELDWPALGARVVFEQGQGRGISLAKLRRAPVTLRLRQGGETLRPHPNAATRTLKNLLQEQHIPPWQRDRLPLLYCGDELVCAAGVAIAAEYQAVADEAGISLVLRPEQDVPGDKNNSSRAL
ncbi:MAG: tRNA lysidine(34) synthetase TilS [Nitrosomonadales bacterium]|nr:tRNA lysidine(34) synthetase TilS [Nitrosomonadales bacterium]